MKLKSKLKVENPAALIFSIFYTIVGIAFLSIYVVYDLKLLHVAIIGILSLITAYGVFKVEKWAVWLVVALFILGNAFGISILAATNPWPAALGLLLQSLLIIYIITTWIISIYVVAKRKNFQ